MVKKVKPAVFMLSSQAGIAAWGNGSVVGEPTLGLGCIVIEDLDQFRIACLDVAYGKAQAYAAGVVFRSWADSQPLLERVVPAGEIQSYEPGYFFRRELPCLLAVQREFPRVDVAIVDGYVWLDTSGRPGLGAHLYEALEGKVTVIGVAKTKFRGAEMARELTRGRSTRPLFISAAGIDLESAVAAIASMHGAYRIPSLLKRADYLCRNPTCSLPD